MIPTPALYPFPQRGPKEDCTLSPTRPTDCCLQSVIVLTLRSCYHNVKKSIDEDSGNVDLKLRCGLIVSSS